MRKTSQDGGDSTSITSGIENEIKKTAAGIVKIKRSSIKRKVQNFSNESDDGVGEPLLQKEKEKVESLNQSAKFILSKTKTDNKNDKIDDKEKSLSDDKIKTFSSIGDSVANGSKDNYKNYGFGAGAVHNHMNTNVFANSDKMKNVHVPKSQILVEIDGTKKSSSYNNSGPLIFTTAKIHTDGTNKHMEPVQMTPVPILSTVEGSLIIDSSLGDVERKIAIGNNILSGEIKKSDTALCTVFGNNQKAPKVTDYSAIVPISKTVASDSTFEHIATIQPVMSKTNTTIGFKVSNEIPQQLITESNNKPEISSLILKNEVSATQTVVYEPKCPLTDHGNNVPNSSKVDVNKNFESSSNESKKSENMKSVLVGKDILNQALQDTSAKIDNSVNKQLHHQKTIEDPKDITKPVKSTSEPTKTQTTTTVLSNIKAGTQDKPSAATNLFTKSIANVSDLKPTPTTSIAIKTPVSTNSISTTKQSNISGCPIKSTPITLSDTLNSKSSVNVKSKSTVATPSNTVNVMTVASQMKPSITSEQQKPIAKSGIPKNPITQVGKTSTLPIKSIKTPDESEEISNKTTANCDNVKVKSSTSSVPSAKSSIKPKFTDKSISTTKPLVTKSNDIISTSIKSLSIGSKPVTTAPCVNTIKSDSSKTKPSNIVSSTGGTGYTTNIKAGAPIPRAVSEVNTSKTSTSDSDTSSKLPQSTLETRSATAGKSPSNLSKTTNNSFYPNVNVTTSKTAQLPSSSKSNNTVSSSTVGMKSPKTNEAPSAPKPSTTHNPNQLERSETKKEKLKNSKLI